MVDPSLPPIVHLGPRRGDPLDVATVETNHDGASLRVREGAQGDCQILRSGSHTLALKPLVLSKPEHRRADLGARQPQAGLNVVVWPHPEKVTVKFFQ